MVSVQLVLLIVAAQAIAVLWIWRILSINTILLNAKLDRIHAVANNNFLKSIQELKAAVAEVQKLKQLLDESHKRENQKHGFLSR